MSAFDLKIPRFFQNDIAQEADITSKKLKNVFEKSMRMNDERLLIIGDKGVKGSKTAPTLAQAYYYAAKDKGIDAEMILQKARSRGQEASKEVVEGLRKLPKNSSIMQCVSNRLGSLNGLGKSFRKFCYNKGHRFTSASSLGGIKKKDFNTLVEAHNYDYRSMKRKQERLKKKLDKAGECQITTPAGTDMHFTLKNSKAVYNHGIYDTYGKGGNLPAGEIYIPINRKSAFGKLVVDGSSRQKDSTVLNKDPINMYFNNGKAEKIQGGKEAKSLESTYRWAESKAKHPWGIRMASELGIGLNEKARVLGATILDEKAKGTAHIATGSNYWFGGDIKAIIHLDQVFHNPTIRLDGKKLNI